MDIKLLWIVLAAFIGGVISALLGWAGSVPPEPFNNRKFIVSFGTSLLAGIFYASTLYAPSGNFLKDLFTALLYVGTGSDVLVNRAIGAIQATKENKPVPPLM
jgi:hypothetical protein